MRKVLAESLFDVGIITLYHQENVWAALKGVVCTPRAGERTFAHQSRQQ